MKKSKSKPSEIVEGMTAAANALGIPKHDIKQAKMEGAPGFRLGNRIDIVELRIWLEKGRTAPGPTSPLYEPRGLEDAVNLMRQWKGPKNELPISFTPLATLACWAHAGMVAKGCASDIAIVLVRKFLEDIRVGRGNELL